MSNKTAFKTIREFLFPEKDKEFVIPNYQRGYKWAVKDKRDSAVEKLCEDLVNANKEQEYFLQGVTVAEENEKVILIDGQQRTTTLYLILWYLKKLNNLKLTYDIRESSKEFINDLKNRDFELFEESNEDNQDVHYFKQAAKQIKEKLKDEDQDEFANFLLDKVTILYIVIDPDKATKTFTMMNGSKATMLQEELAKAEILRRISLPETKEKEVSTSVDNNLLELKEIITQDWETNALRSRYAREWDKWLYWWNRKEVHEFFDVKNPMGLLLKYYYWSKLNGNNQKNEEKFSFESFRSLLIDNGNNQKQKTKLVFKELRDLQKSFEDIFKKPKIHNYLKMSLLCSTGEKDKYNIIKYFMSKKNEDNFSDDYAKWRLVGATHLEIVNPEKSPSELTPKQRAEDMLIKLKGHFVYEEAYDLAAKQFLRVNVEEENKLFDGKGRKFDFSIYGNKSLEHIHPKSKVYISIVPEGEELSYFYGNNETVEEKKNSKQWLDRTGFEEKGAEHCVGNLVLLDKNENSKFNDKPFNEKKQIYFNVNECFKSRNLLHSISVFSKSDWGIKEILDNKNKFIERIKEDYEIKDLSNDNE